MEETFVLRALSCIFLIYLTSSIQVAKANNVIESDAVNFARQQQQKLPKLIKTWNSDTQTIRQQTTTTLQNNVSETTDLKKLLNQYVNELPTFKNLTIPKTKLLVFVSFSMPTQSLKQWLSQTQKAGGTLIIRGLVNHTFKETVKRISEILDNKTGGLQLDPTLFKKYGIHQVPAVVVMQVIIMT